MCEAKSESECKSEGSHVTTNIRRPRINATDRLHRVLAELLKITTNAEQALVIAQVLGVPNDDKDRAALDAYSLVELLLERSEGEIIKHCSDDVSALGLAHLGIIRSTLSPRLSTTPWINCRNQLTGGAFSGVQMLAMLLKKDVHEPELNSEDLDPLTEAIAELADAFDDAGLSEYARNLLQERLEAIITAAENYHWWGGPGLNTAFQQFAGAVATNEELKAAVAKTEEPSSNFSSKFWILFGRIALIASLLNDGRQLLTNPTPQLHQFTLPAPPSVPPLKGDPLVNL